MPGAVGPHIAAGCGVGISVFEVDAHVDADIAAAVDAGGSAVFCDEHARLLITPVVAEHHIWLPVCT